MITDEQIETLVSAAVNGNETAARIVNAVLDASLPSNPVVRDEPDLLLEGPEFEAWLKQRGGAA
jgi:hypothetical protein